MKHNSAFGSPVFNGRLKCVRHVLHLYYSNVSIKYIISIYPKNAVFIHVDKCGKPLRHFSDAKKTPDMQNISS